MRNGRGDARCQGVKNYLVGKLMVSAQTAQPRIGLQLVNDRDEIVEADDPLELETGTLVACPDNIGFDPSYQGQADDHTVAALKTFGIIDHEAMRGEIRDMQLEIAQTAMFGHHREIDRVTRGAAQVGQTAIGSGTHGFFPKDMPLKAWLPDSR